jgi:hypothetical protein
VHYSSILNTHHWYEAIKSQSAEHMTATEENQWTCVRKRALNSSNWPVRVDWAVHGIHLPNGEHGSDRLGAPAALHEGHRLAA